MSHEKFFVSKRLSEIWEIKDAIAERVSHLPTREALAEVMRIAAETTRNMSLNRSDPRQAENATNYEKAHKS
jgi:hypothetical protein